MSPQVGGGRFDRRGAGDIARYLVRSEVNAAIEDGLLNPPDSEWDSWFMTELVRSVYHYYAFAPHADGELELVKERLWRFCLTALGGATHP